jgi:hypothetical protein
VTLVVAELQLAVLVHQADGGGYRRVTDTGSQCCDAQDLGHIDLLGSLRLSDLVPYSGKG